MSGFTIYNRGLYELVSLAVSGSTDLRALIIKGTVTGVDVKTLNTVADVLAVSGVAEAAVSGYGRIDLGGVALAEDDGNNRVRFSASIPTLPLVSAGETWLAIVYYIEGASDVARNLIGVDVPASSMLTNGGDITLPQFIIDLTAV